MKMTWSYIIFSTTLKASRGKLILCCMLMDPYGTVIVLLILCVNLTESRDAQIKLWSVSVRTFLGKISIWIYLLKVVSFPPCGWGIIWSIVKSTVKIKLNYVMYSISRIGLVLKKLHPWWLGQWRICLQCGRCGSDPCGNITWRREWLPTPSIQNTQYSCLENPMDREPDGLQSMGSQSQTRLSA